MKTTFLLLSFIVILYSCGEREHRSENLYRPKVLFSDHNDSLTNIIINTPSVEYCGAWHSHFVDIIARDKIDSLRNIGTETILFYRDWIGVNGQNGYGKLIWLQNNTVYQYQINFEAHEGRYGISSIDKAEMKKCEALAFYIQKRMDTVTSEPAPPQFPTSHASDHFVYVFHDDKENCFSISGLCLKSDSLHLKSQMIKKIMIPFREYFDMLEGRRKTEENPLAKNETSLKDSLDGQFKKSLAP